MPQSLSVNPSPIVIQGTPIGAGYPPYMIAEVSCNHMGSFERAKNIIKAAAQAGADAVKLQTYTADTITLDAPQPHFQIHHPLWNNTSFHRLYQQGQTPFEWMKPLFEYGAEQGVTVFSAPFDFSAAELLIGLDAPLYKIASFEAVHLPLIRKVAATGKPLIISTGIANEREIDEAVAAARDAGCRDLILLHCISAYPTPLEEANLRTIELLRARYGVMVGLSDHTTSTLAAEIAVGLGAVMVEKHVMLNKDDDTLDKAFSLTPDAFADLVSVCKAQTTERFAEQRHDPMVEAALGTASFAFKAGEEKSAAFRPSIMAASSIKPGDIFSADNLIIRRPAAGLAPKYWDTLIGQTATRAFERGDALTPADLPKAVKAA